MKPRNQGSRSAIELIKRFEGYRRKSAQLPDGRWTIGHGHTQTAREGAEVSALLPLAEAWSLELAWTWLDAHVRDGFPICTAAGCTNPSVLVPAGTSIPGTARQQAFARVQWQPRAWRVALEAVGMSAVGVNDVGSERAPSYVVANAEAARTWRLARGSLRAFARVDNLFDHDYVGSVIVNEGNGRYYEPAPGRGWLFGLRWNWSATGGG